jgi:molecular chaperone GrpE
MPERTHPPPGDRVSEAGQASRTASAPDDVQTLRDRAEAAERRRDEYLDLLQRTRAEFENYQKRARRDLDEERRYALAPLARELLPVLDNLQRALRTARRESEQDPLTEGVGMVESQLLDVLRRFGVTPTTALGRSFDPMLDEAVAQEPGAEAAPGTVVRVLEPGYRLHERVLRPARVVVAAPPPG